MIACCSNGPTATIKPCYLSYWSLKFQNVTHLGTTLIDIKYLPPRTLSFPLGGKSGY